MPGPSHPDCDVLAQMGKAVRSRLARQPRARCFKDDRIELYAIEGFVGASACQRMMDLIDQSAEPSCLLQDKPNFIDYRTSSSSDLDQADSCVRNLESRLCQLTGITASCSEAVQGQRYRCGEYFHEHCDWFDTASDYWSLESRCGGQRSWTAMLYLNTVEQGGTTDFTRVALRIKPRAGVLLLWNNALPDGSPNPYTMHAARPVLEGNKYVVTKWFRAHVWQ